MVLTQLAAVVSVALRSLAVTRLQRLNIGTPVAMVACGAVVVITVESLVGAVLNTQTTLTTAELILAVLLLSSPTAPSGTWNCRP